MIYMLNKTSRWILLLSAPMLLAAILSGCNTDPRRGYSLSSQYRPGVRSVAVQIFTRGPDVYRREVEFRLTEAVIKRIELDTPYKVTSKSRADTILTGRIDSIYQRTMSTHPDTEQPNEQEIIITASITWSDLRSGKKILEDKKLRAAGIYIPAGRFDEDFFDGSEAAINRLAKRIVEQMEADW